MFLKIKKLSQNYPRWRCRREKSVCRPSFLKTSQEAAVTDLFEATPSRANFLAAAAFWKRRVCETKSEQRTKERSCVCK